MKLLKNAFVLSLVAFWAVMTSHCGLESISGLSFLACESEAESSAHQSSDCGDNDACATVESGLYKKEDNKGVVEQSHLLMPVVALLAVSHLELCQSSSYPPRSEVAPPGFSQGWQFFFRTALPPRAPSLLA